MSSPASPAPVPDAHSGTGTPIAPEYEFVSTTNHKTRVLLGLAVLTPAVIVGLLWGSLRTSGVAILFLIFAAPFLLAAWVTKRLGHQRDEAMSKSRQGNYLFFWPFDEQESAEYRTVLDRRLRLAARNSYSCCYRGFWEWSVRPCLVSGKQAQESISIM